MVALSYLSFASRVFLILVSTVSQMFLPKSLGGLGFTRICSHITPMQVVSMQPCEKHRVFKVSLFLLWFQHDHILIQMFLTLICVCVCVFQVETIGGAYMVVAGAPEKTKYHAHNICDMTLDGWFY